MSADSIPGHPDPSDKPRGGGTIAPRLLIGLVVLISAEVFSGSSLKGGLLQPWAWIVTFCLYLALLYGVTYRALRPEGLPSVGIQLATLLFYAAAIGGLVLHRRRFPLPANGPRAIVAGRERRLAAAIPVAILALGLGLSFFAGHPAQFMPIIISFALWTPLGLLLFAISLGKAAVGRPRGGDSAAI